MREKTIITTVTLVGRENHRVVQHPPGKPVTLPADEADSILKRFGGEEVKQPASAPAE